MATAKRSLVTNAAKELARPHDGKPDDYDELLKLVHEARFCLLGEATHGTHEFYRERAEITKRLIKEKNNFVAMAHELEGGRSIMMIRSTSDKDGKLQSNIRWRYGHDTILRPSPRYCGN